MTGHRLSRRYRFLIWLAGISVLLLAAAYASLPKVMAGFINHALAAHGLTHVSVKVDYPGWRGVQLHALQFSGTAGDQRFSVQIQDIGIEYHVTRLLAGKVTRVLVPAAVVQIHPAPTTEPPTREYNMLPLAALMPDQWWSRLPMGELLLEQLSIDWNTTAGAINTLRVTGNLHDAVMQLDGELNLPIEQRRLRLLLTAHSTGELRLSLSPPVGAATPMLELSASAVTTDQGRRRIDGVLNARLDSLASFVEPWLAVTQWVPGLAGDFQGRWQLRGDLTNWHVAGDAAVTGLTGLIGEQPLPRSNLQVGFRSDRQQATLQAKLGAADGAVAVEAKGNHHFVNGNGQADITFGPVVFGDAGFALSHLLESWPYPLDITSGRVSGSSTLAWQTPTATDGKWRWRTEPALQLQLDRLGGHYRDNIFYGLSGRLDLVYRDGVHTTTPARLTMAMLDAGLPIGNIVTDFSIRQPVIYVTRFSAGLLGGRAHSEPFQWDMGRDRQQFTVQLEQLKLSDIMLLEQQEGLEGTGLLDGRLPIAITSKGIEVQRGQLTARAPGGDIHYLPNEKVRAMAQTNASIKLLVDALSNFQYHTLDVNSDYAPDGNLAMQVSLKGMNPEWQEGQPVHLNLNLQENIPALLRSLQLADELTGEITERVRKGYEKTR